MIYLERLGRRNLGFSDSSSGKLSELPQTRGSDFLGLSKDNATVLFRAHMDREEEEF